MRYKCNICENKCKNQQLRHIKLAVPKVRLTSYSYSYLEEKQIYWNDNNFAWRTRDHPCRPYTNHFLYPLYSSPFYSANNANTSQLKGSKSRFFKCLKCSSNSYWCSSNKRVRLPNDPLKGVYLNNYLVIELVARTMHDFKC